MTSTTQTQPTALSDAGRQLSLAAMSAIYDKQAIDMFHQQLQQGKSKKAIPMTVALAATSILQHLGPKGTQLPEKEMWGKGGVVQSILGALFELAKELGYNAPHSDLKPAYQIVEEQIGKSGFGNGPQSQQGAPGGDPSQGATQGPPQGGPSPQQPPSMMGGAMPQGMQQ